MTITNPVMVQKDGNIVVPSPMAEISTTALLGILTSFLGGIGLLGLKKRRK